MDQQPAALTAPTAGTYLLVHGDGAAELWRIGDEDGAQVEPELADLVVEPMAAGSTRPRGSGR